MSFISPHLPLDALRAKKADVWHRPSSFSSGSDPRSLTSSHTGSTIPSWLSYSQYHPQPASPPLPEVDNLSSTNYQLLVLTTLQPMHMSISLSYNYIINYLFHLLSQSILIDHLTCARYQDKDELQFSESQEKTSK